MWKSRVIEHLVETNSKLTEIINRLSDCHKPRIQKSLSATYFTVDKSGDIVFNHLKNKQIMEILVLPNQNSVPGQLVPVAADNVTREPISTIQPGSESYEVVDEATGLTSTVATAAAVAGGAEGQFSVDRIAGQSGVVLLTYKAVAADGTTPLTNVGGVPDRITFQGQPTGVAAALTADYGTASLKKK